MSDHSNQPKWLDEHQQSVAARPAAPSTVADLVNMLLKMPPDTPVRLGGSVKDYHHIVTSVALDARGFVRIDG